MGWFHAEFANGTFDAAEYNGDTNNTNVCALPPKTKTTPPCPKDLTGVEVIYHMCLREEWEEAVRDQSAYFSPTFHKDGRFTRASVYKETLLDTANQFYKATSPASQRWICLEINLKLLLDLGVVVLPQEEDTTTSNTNNITTGEEKKDSNEPDVQCLQIYGGITTLVPGLVPKSYTMKRGGCGTFLALQEEPKQPKKETQQHIPGIGSVPAADQAQPPREKNAKKTSSKSSSSLSPPPPPEQAKTTSKSKSKVGDQLPPEDIPGNNLNACFSKFLDALEAERLLVGE